MGSRSSYCKQKISPDTPKSLLTTESNAMMKIVNCFPVLAPFVTVIILSTASRLLPPAFTQLIGSQNGKSAGFCCTIRCNAATAFNFFSSQLLNSPTLADHSHKLCMKPLVCPTPIAFPKPQLPLKLACCYSK